MRRALISTAILLLAGGAIARAAQEVSVRTLLPELTDLKALAKKASPAYTEVQASSYDRASTGPDKPNWFANGDAGQFIRVEERDGHREYVMMDAKGAGAIVRFWSANPSGIVRFYFDGSETPNWECKLDDLLGGRIEPFTDPFAYVASSGWNLYFPIPYAKSLKVTVDDGGRGIYYQIGYRTFAAGTKVRTFTLGGLNEVKPLMAKIGKELLSSQKDVTVKADAATKIDALRLPAGATKTALTLKAGAKGSQIVLFRAKLNGGAPESREDEKAWSDPKAVQNRLRSLILKIDFDGERCVEVPLGDFFGSAPGLNPYKSLPMEVDKDGWMTCRFVMPFSKVATVELSNVGAVESSVSIFAVLETATFDKNTYHFRAQWTVERSKTRPIKDMEFLNVHGEGKWVGVSAFIANPVPDWWGEGDEKVYVDGEAFPSTFGTGTEDYFGYAWCNPTPFMRPFHVQPRADGPRNYGHTTNIRWHVLDCIPYAKSLKFDMELWNWVDTTNTYARTAYWYAKPGGTPPAKIDRTLLALPYLAPTNKVKGAIEGEGLSSTKTGGETEVQGDFWDASAGKHLWWKNAAEGDKLTIRVPVAEDGEYEVVLGLGMAPDYGKHKLCVLGGSDDARITGVDLYADGLRWKPFSLGTYRLQKGEVRLEVSQDGRNAAARPGNMFALDYVLLKKK
jgi:hypothetical protein